jgi:serine/threonine-protein kinase
MSETLEPNRPSGPSPGKLDRRVESLAEQFLDLLQAGQSPDRRAWVSANADIAEELDRRLAVVEMMFRARPTGDAVPPVDREATTLAPSAPASVPGTRIRYFGDYELLEEIARGGMGVVYKARQVSLNRLVAIKMILAGQLAGPDDVRRFRAEAEAAAQLQHPNIVAIHEVGEHDGQHYFAMDYIEGTSLAALVRESPLPAKQAAAIVKTVAEAIDYAHAKGILHRDLKLSNVLISFNREPQATASPLSAPSEFPVASGSRLNVRRSCRRTCGDPKRSTS